MTLLLHDGWIWIWTVVTYLCFVSGQTPCSALNGKTGVCMSIFDCDVVLDSVLSATSARPSPFSHGLCGLDMTNKIVQVCCPSNECQTPEGKQGTCVKLDSCPRMLETLRRTHTIHEIEYLHSHICHSKEKNTICCASETPYSPKGKPDEENTDLTDPYPVGHTTTTSIKTQEGEEEGKCMLGTELPDPESLCCGWDASTQPKIVGGVETLIDEFPWLALLEYWINNSLQTYCGGTLITGIHVLTAAHCMIPELVNVRLGEHNQTHPGKDCVVTGSANDCNHGALTIAVDKYQVHPNYVSDIQNNISRVHHDIAIIKLQFIVPFTDFIRPICMPTNDITTLKKNDRLVVSGWGKTENNIASDVKRQVSVPFVPFEDCRKLWQQFADIIESQLCAGGEPKKDSCKRDSGGPLMRKVNEQYELVGVVSFGVSPCGPSAIPAVYAKVSRYLPWIKNQIATM